jgi:arylsulfatase A-like enzyme
MTPPVNIILLAVDTLRADHLSCYGYARETSPTLDRLAQEGALVENFVCAVLPTQPSFTTLYTGQHPITHGVVAHGGRAQLSREAPFLPPLLLTEGYTTCAIDNLVQTRPWFGRGYEYYVNPSLRHGLLLDVSCEELNGRAIPWLKSHADEPFFLFIHYWDPHWPLLPPARYRDLFYTGNPTDPTNTSLEKWMEHPLGQLARDTWLVRQDGTITDAAYVEALYDQEIRHLDDGIADLLLTVDDLGLTDNTLVMVIGDHGESMTEHGIYFSHFGLYEPTLHVPLIVRWPGHIPAGRRYPQIAQHQDLAPTLLEAAGIEVPMEMDGESLLPLLTGESAHGGREKAYCCECTWQAKWCVRTSRYKLIVDRDDSSDGPPRELYDLVEDPGETSNLVDSRPGVARELEEDLEEWIATRLAELGQTEDPIGPQSISRVAG